MQRWHRLSTWIRQNPWLTATLVIAFLLRVGNIGWGIPITPHSNFYHGDEAKAYSSTVDFPERYLSNESYLYGTSIQYSVGVLLLPVKFVMVGMWKMPQGYELTAIVFIRFCSVLMGTASVFLVYVLTRKLISERAGTISAMLLAVAPYSVLNSPLTTLDVPMSLLALCCVLLCLRCLERPSQRTFCYAGVAAGMLLGTKVTGVLFVGCSFVWLAAGLFVKPAESKLPTSERLALLIVFVATSVAVFALSTPHVALDFGEYWTFMMNQKSNWYDKAPTTLAGVAYAWFDGTAMAAGIAVTITCVLGMFLTQKAHRQQIALLGLSVAVYYLFWRAYLPPRFVIVVVPFLCLWSAAFWSWSLDRPTRWIRRAGTAALALGIIWALLLCVGGIALGWLDSRNVASRYIAQHVPRDSTIGIATDHNDHWVHHNWRYPRIDFQTYHDTPFLERPEFLVVTSIELERMREALNSDKLLADDRWNPEFNREWYQNDPPAPEVFGFYRALLAGEIYDESAVFAPPFRLRIDSAPPDVLLFRRKGT